MGVRVRGLYSLVDAFNQVGEGVYNVTLFAREKPCFGLCDELLGR